MSTSSTSPVAPAVRQPGEGTVYHVAQHDNRCILSAEATGGAFSLFEIVSPPGDRVPLHIHTREDEAFLVLEGEIELTVGDAVHRLRPGSVVFGPRGIAHSFCNPCTVTSRMLVMTTPGGFERFFAECHERLPRTRPFDPALFVEIIRKHGMIIPE